MAQPSNREQLVKGAVKCLRTKGYAHTTARDIASASGANLASIGYHFGSKEALLNEAMIRVFAERNRRVGERVFSDAAATPLESLTNLFGAIDDVFKSPRPLFISFLEAIAQAGRSPELREPLASHYRDARREVATSLRAVLGPAADAGDDVEAMATFLMALFDGLVLQWLLDPDAMPTGQRLLSTLVDTMTTVLGQSKVRADA